MSQVTVYVRKDDQEKWESIAKKSQFIHDALERLADQNIGTGFYKENISTIGRVKKYYKLQNDNIIDEPRTVKGDWGA